MGKKTPKDGLISRTNQMEALASPVRHQLHLAMEMLGPCSVRELASRLGREPATLYYHVNMMERVGILTKCGVRTQTQREEAIYSLAGKQVRVDMTQRSERFVRAVARGCGALLRYAERAFIAALRKDATIKTGKASEMRVRQASVRLTRKSLIEINARLDELQTFINESDSPDTDTAYIITLCVAPDAGGDWARSAM